MSGIFEKCPTCGGCTVIKPIVDMLALYEGLAALESDINDFSHLPPPAEIEEGRVFYCIRHDPSFIWVRLSSDGKNYNLSL